MSNELDEANAFLMQQGAKAFPFANRGDAVTGIITQLAMRQQTDIDTGEPQFWRDGKPRMMLVIVLQTELQEDDNDDGLRSLYLRGGNYTPADGKGTSSLTAVRDAVKAAGAERVAVGARLTVGYTGDGQKSNNKFSAPKLYSAKYEPPTANVALEELL